MPWPHRKEMVFFLVLSSVGGEASCCSGVVWALWCYTLVTLLFQFYLFFSLGLAYNTEIIGPGWLQIMASVLNQESLLFDH